MHVSGTVTTPLGSKYIHKLCKHFTHRVPAEWDELTGIVRFDMGTCTITATNETLTFGCEAQTEDDLNAILETVKSHFDRFALKDQLELNWQDNNTK
ncbi:DUF2218 domain-containing protein [Alkalimarinus alittae]|uniref:DUF2218 domain-containing protein n=1 Tax=Alkalimarinus alittae TaxID=2961619 RepID=A0ABY6N4K7_9ALTE|nr:DUF2218 domain-containing protein [Alkalimarinus alittae]UZE97061.1 DUF2218 domain-containing protein [Alkalimarinus alittae]